MEHKPIREGRAIDDETIARRREQDRYARKKAVNRETRPLTEQEERLVRRFGGAKKDER